MGVKVCDTCEQSKETVAFPKSRNTSDGFATTCKDCRESYRTSGERALRAAQQNRHYYRKKAEIHRLLGGKCVCTGCEHCGDHPGEPCGSKDDLEVDHHDGEGGGWQSKNFEVLARQLSLSDPRVKKELQGCVLLCKPCHARKTVLDRAEQRANPEVLKERNKSGWLAHERVKRGRKN